MSYRLQKSGEFNPDIFSAGFIDYTSGGKDGVVEGILDELEVTHEDNKIILGRGKLIVSGYPVLFEGREVIGISSEYENGAYMLVGVLNVSGREAKSFYLSVRQAGELRCDDVLAKGEGVVEVVLVDFVIKKGKITECIQSFEKIVGGKPEENAEEIQNLSRRIDDLADTSEASYTKIIENSVDGRIYLTDCQKGCFKDLKLFGACKISGKSVNYVPSTMKIVSRSKNCFNYEGFVADMDFNGTNKVFYNACEEEVVKENNGYTIIGYKAMSADCFEPTNGILQVNMNTMHKGVEYTLSFDVIAHSIWEEENVSNQMGFSVNSGSTQLLSQALEIAVGEKRHFSFTITTVTNELRLAYYFYGSKATIANIQIERGNVETEYTKFEGETYEFTFKGIDGTLHQIGGIGDVCDEVYMENDVPILLKKTGRSNQNITDAKPGSTYKRYSGEEVTENGEITVASGEYVVYELNEYKKIMLDKTVLPIKSVKSYYPITEVSIVGSYDVKFSAKYGRDINEVLKRIEEKINAL